MEEWQRRLHKDRKRHERQRMEEQGSLTRSRRRSCGEGGLQVLADEE